MRNRLRILPPVLACLALALAVAACGSSDDGPTPVPSSIKGRAVVSVGVPAPIPSSTLADLQSVLKARLDDASVTNTITSGSGSDINIDFEGPRSTNFISTLVSAQGVRFKVPVLDGTAIKCKDTSGQEFSIDPQLLQQSGNLPVCVNSDGRHGEIEWVPATAQLNATDTELVGGMISKTHVAIITDSNGNEVLNADFDANGTVLLAQVSQALVANDKHYPLGVFLGDSLQMAPLIQRQITNGRITLAGATVEGMEELGAILKGGELSAPVTLASIEQQ